VIFRKGVVGNFGDYKRIWMFRFSAIDAALQFEMIKLENFMFEEATENRKHVFLYIQFCSFAKYCV
jgi:hypothetical protein